MVVLDLGLPDVDGKEVITVLRRFSQVPIIELSARDREAEKIAALVLGADDYVSKPFGIGELLARIRTALRHRPTPREQPTSHAVGDLRLDIAAHRVTRRGQAIKLTPTEFELLTVLARHPGRVITHRQLLTEVWGPAHAGDVPYLRVFVGQLRQKIEDDPNDPKLLLTEPGVGYRLREPEG